MLQDLNSDFSLDPTSLLWLKSHHLPKSLSQSTTGNNTNNFSIPLNKEIPDNFIISILYSCSGKSASGGNGQYSFDNLDISTNQQNSAYSWNKVDNPAYTLMLDGHFYLKESRSMDNKSNLRKLLDHISVTTIEKGLAHIAGGMFNLIIVDKQKKRLVVTSDPTSSIPLYYLQRNRGFFLSGNQFAFLPATSVFEASAVEFLKYGFLPFSYSLLEDVKRLLPGQMLYISLESPSNEISTSKVFEFKPLHYRINDLQEAGEQVHQAFNHYFSRFKQANYCIGLNGDYDSRLLAAWLEPLTPQLLSLGKENSATGKIAQKIAKRYKLPLEYFPFSSDLFSEYLSRLVSKFRLMCSLEHAQMFYIHHHIKTTLPDIYLDGYLGKSVMGSNFDNIGTNLKSLINYMQGKEVYNTPIRSIEFYQRFLYNSPGALPDHMLSEMLTPDIEIWFLNAARGILEINRYAGQFHEDYVESLTNYTRYRCLEAARPVAISAHTLCACPFLDYEVMQICYSIDKKLRAGESFYNYYWRTYFKELAKISKAYAGGNSQDNKRLYRFKKFIYEKIFAGSNKSSMYSSANSSKIVLNAPKNKKLISEAFDEPAAGMPVAIFKRLYTLYLKKKLTNTLLMRYISLNAYLKKSAV